MNGPIISQDLNASIKVLNDVIYNYFANSFGYSETIPDNNLVHKYKDETVKEMKKALRNLKSTNADPAEIKYVSSALRDKLRNNNNKNTQSDKNRDEPLNHNRYIERNLWGYVKNVLNKQHTELPSFSVTECLNYFTKTLAAIHPRKLFNIPSWIPKLCIQTSNLTLTRQPINKSQL